MRKISLVSALSVAVLFGCAVDPVEQQLDRDQMVNESNKTKAEKLLESVPDWYLTPQTNDFSGMYGVGSATSTDMNYAIKKAKLQAEFSLAKLYRQEISGSERVYEREGANGELVQSTQFLIDKIIDSVPVVGYEIVNQDLQVTEEGKFRSYMLLKLPYERFNKVLQEMKSEAQSKNETDAFLELERRLEKRRQAKVENEERKHSMKIDMLNAKKPAEKAIVLTPREQQGEQPEAQKGEINDVVSTVSKVLVGG